MRNSVRAIFVVSVLVFVAALVVSAAPRNPRARTSSASAADGPIAILSPSEPGFHAALSAHFSGIETVPDFARIEPYLLLLHNGSAHAVLAYAIEWHLDLANGSKKAISAVVISAPGTKLALSGQKPIVGPHGWLVVSPFFYWSAAEFQSLIATKEAASQFQSALKDPQLAGFQGWPTVDPLLDGAVLSDGTFIGPDTLQLFERFQATQKAEFELGEWVLAQFSQPGGADELDLNTIFRNQIRAGRAPLFGPAPSFYIAARGEEAARLHECLHKKGMKALRQLAVRLTFSDPLPLRRAAASAAKTP